MHGNQVYLIGRVLFDAMKASWPFLTILPCLCFGAGWSIDGDRGIAMESPRGVGDHFEMSARGIDAVVRWKVSESGVWQREGEMRFPTLRDEKDDTYGSWRVRFPDDVASEVRVNGRGFSPGSVLCVRIGASLVAEIDHGDEGIREMRTIFPALSASALIEEVVLTNESDAVKTVEVVALSRREEGTGVFGRTVCDGFSVGDGCFRLAPGAFLRYARCVAGRAENDPCYYPDIEAERAARLTLWREASDMLVLETPSPEIDALFRFAKFRTLESLYATRAGLVHSPGGVHYLAAIWANDQAEYACPLLAYLGHPSAKEATKTCLRWFAQRMNDGYRPIPSSIIAENRSFWNGAGDRGDQAMMAHGAARTALSLGDAAFAEEMTPFVLWCLEFGRRKTGVDGVVASDSDELEGRLPAGRANLCTSSLQYDALMRAADLTGEAKLRDEARALEESIERHFGERVEGFDTYRYYEGNDRLRSWIAIPLCFGMDRRVDGTAAAVFSKRLWDGVGLRSVSGQSGYWDRSTLYAFRGLAFCGKADMVLPRVEAYARARLLGRHVPYPVEAFPEGGGRHLAAESALFARVFTEGFFGLTPTGLHSFSIKPNLPSIWNRAALRNVRAHGAEFDVLLERRGGRIRVRVTEGHPVQCIFECEIEDGGSSFVDVFPDISKLRQAESAAHHTEMTGE